MPEGVPIQMGFKHVAPNWLLYQGERDLQEARTAAFTVLVLAQLVHACNCRVDMGYGWISDVADDDGAATHNGDLESGPALARKSIQDYHSYTWENMMRRNYG